MQRAIVDLPQPDSPTTPSVSPSLTVKETPSTALTAPTCFWKMIPRVTGKCFFRSSTTRSSAPEPVEFVEHGLVTAGLRHHPGEQLLGLAVLRLVVEVTGLEMVGVVRDRQRARAPAPCRRSSRTGSADGSGSRAAG